MMNKQRFVDVDQAKRDLSELVDEVAGGNVQITITVDGHPMARLISLDILETLKKEEARKGESLEQFLADSRELAESIHRRRGGVPLDLDEDWRTFHDEMGKR